MAPDPDLDAMRETAAGCGWSFEELAQRYAANAERELRALAAALEAGDGSTAERLAHGLAGASEMAGASAVGRALRRAEGSAGRGDLGQARRHAREARESFDRLRRLLGLAHGPGTVDPG